MRIPLTLLTLVLLTSAAFGQIPKRALKKMGMFPIFFLDSMEIGRSELEKLDPFDISNITIVTPKKAKKLLDDKGADGAVYITTVKFARFTYWNYFRTRSVEYKQLFPTRQADTLVEYVLNGQVLSDAVAPGSLFLISNKNLKKINILAKEKSPGDTFTHKQYVVAITAKRPKGLVKTIDSK